VTFSFVVARGNIFSVSNTGLLRVVDLTLTTELSRLCRGYEGIKCGNIALTQCCWSIVTDILKEQLCLYFLRSARGVGCLFNYTFHCAGCIESILVRWVNDELARILGVAVVT
jgi:hypothetical protein